MYEHYDQTVLLMNCSQGSSLSNYFDTVVEVKKKETVSFLKSIGMKEIDYELLSIVMSSEMQNFTSIIKLECSPQDARRYMSAMADYNISGWQAIQHLICRP